MHNFSGKGGGDTPGNVDSFIASALVNPAKVCYTELVNVKKCPFEIKGHKYILFYHNWDRLSRPILFFYEKKRSPSGS